MSALKPTPFPPAMRPKNRERGTNWLMILVVAVVVLGIVLLLTDEFGAKASAGHHNDFAHDALFV